MQVYLKVWRQQTKASRGHFADYSIADVSPDMSFLEMLDLLNDRLIRQGERPIEFDHDCREGICGQCGVMINGRAHGPLPNTTTCQLHMRTFAEGSTIYVEPFRADAFPIKCDLKVDRSAFDRIIQVGGYVSASTGEAPEANSIPIGHATAEAAFDAAACIGCGACVATCKTRARLCSQQLKSCTWLYFPRGKSRGDNVLYEWWHKWIERDSGTAAIRKHARWNARRRSRCCTSLA